MKQLLPLAALAVLILLVAPHGEASGDNTACFDWSCNGSYPSTTCTFNPGCSVTNSGSGWRDQWTYGPNGGDLVSPGTVTTKVFPASPTFFDVTLLKYHFSGNSPSVACEIILRNVVGPPQPLNGRCQ